LEYRWHCALPYFVTPACPVEGTEDDAAIAAADCGGVVVATRKRRRTNAPGGEPMAAAKNCSATCWFEPPVGGSADGKIMRIGNVHAHQ
jgi:hypothetical protein